MSNSANKPSISAVFPAYNDGGTIPSMVLRARSALKELGHEFEIIVTDDGSADYTGKILDDLAQIVPELQVIHHPQNKGYGHALRSGFDASTKDLVFYTDGDAQYDPGLLGELLAALEDDIDIVNGYKISRNDPWHRIIIGRIYHHLMRLLFGYAIRDVDCDYRLIRRRCFDAVTLESPDGTLPLEMVKKWSDHGFRFVEIPVPHFHRVYGQSQFFNLPRLIAVVFEILRLWWRLEVKQAHLHGEESTSKTIRRYTGRLFKEPKLLGRMSVVALITYLGLGFGLGGLFIGLELLNTNARNLILDNFFWDGAIGLAGIGLKNLLAWPWVLIDLLRGLFA